MSLTTARRASVVGLVLALGAAGMVTADTLTADDDALAGVQASVDLGEVETGSEHTVFVDFVLACTGSSHLTPGATVSVVDFLVTVPGDGGLGVVPGSVTVPADWPANGLPCTGSEADATVTPARLDVTAPSSAGDNQTFDILFALAPEEETVANAIAFAVVMDVVDPAPVDSAAPTLHGVPDDITVQTTGVDAVVTFPLPTATDDTDPSPTVSCDPASGSTFLLGSTTVTCTARDAAGNEAQADFTVTVEAASTGDPTLTGTWRRPLEDAVPALVANPGRTVPLKLDVLAGGDTQGPAAIDAPRLLVERLAGCSLDSSSVGAVALGAFEWGDGFWQRNLDTSPFGQACIRVTALGDDALASAVIQLAPTASPAKRAR